MNGMMKLLGSFAVTSIAPAAPRRARVGHWSVSPALLNGDQLAHVRDDLATVQLDGSRLARLPVLEIERDLAARP
jgi:hypothetical protein